MSGNLAASLSASIYILTYPRLLADDSLRLLGDEVAELTLIFLEFVSRFFVVTETLTSGLYAPSLFYFYDFLAFS